MASCGGVCVCAKRKTAISMVPIIAGATHKTYKVYKHEQWRCQSEILWLAARTACRSLPK